MIQATDEQPHAPAASEHAQESWYFNWTDATHDVFGLARLGYRYHARTPEPLVLTITGDRPELVFPTGAVPPLEGAWHELDAARGLRAGDMIVIMEEPLERWRVRLDGAQRMDLVFESFTPAFDYHEAGRRLAASMTTEHFEQSCRVTGWTEFGGKRLQIDGLGQRDKSWGVRVWPVIEGWDWISAQFGEDLSFNVMRTLEGGEALVNGFVFHEGRNRAIERLELAYAWGAQEHQPRSARLEIHDSDGARHAITSATRGTFPIPRSGLLLVEAYSRFQYRGPAGTREGRGVIEHVWRP